MKAQNNVNYNSNPAFGSGRLVVKGSREAAENFARALHGGCLARSEEILPIFGEVEHYIVVGKDVDLFEKVSFESKQNNPRGFIDFAELKKSFFGIGEESGERKADVIEIRDNKPLTLCFKFAENAKDAAIRMVKALAGGFTSQEKTLVNNESLINIHDFGDKIYFTKGFVAKLRDNAQVIHVTE